MKLFCSILIIISFTISCKKSSSAGSTVNTDPFTIIGNKIYNANNPAQLIGANTLHVFSAGSRDMNAWNIDIAREFIGNVKEQPLKGTSIKDANGSYLYSLQTIVDSNRINKRITILCPFGWDGTNSTLFTGTMPAQTIWWTNFKTQLQQWATQFADQPDVWIEVWNEPYRYDRTDSYTDDIWMNDMNSLVSIIRNIGNQNIILVPCAEQGQDESVLNNKGVAFLNGKKNILFDIHAYEKWLLVPATQIGSRLQQLKDNNIPVVFGETAPINAGALMNPSSFLDSVYNRGISVCAWVWENDSSDQDALLNDLGLPNNINNNNWGDTFKNISLKPRNP